MHGVTPPLPILLDDGMLNKSPGTTAPFVLFYIRIQFQNINTASIPRKL